MKRILPSRKAEQDAREIWEYIAVDNPSAATRLVERFAEKLEQVARHPLIGQTFEHVRPGVRGVRVGSYMLFYREAADCIHLVRILHHARRWELLL